MTKRSKWVRVPLPSGGSAKVRSDVSPETIAALDKLMQTAVQKYLAGELKVIGDPEPKRTPAEREARARAFWGDAIYDSSTNPTGNKT